MREEKRKVGVPLNLQFFAEPGGDPTPPAKDPTSTGEQIQTPQFDYQKLADLITGKQSVTEDTVLKSYFKQQGLSPEEAQQAIAAFKQQKAASQPDVGALQTQVTQAQQQAQQAMIERDSYLLAGELGVDSKTMPYILKMADLSDVVGTDGKVAQDKLKEALNKVLETLPQLKIQTQQATGFQFGAPGTTSTQTAVDKQLDNIFGIKN
ncbi:MAG: hypothetical protein IJZ53_07570 [Tyzzerella sp.]|nr:hypothetical protein [Tyzzerella sp.]